MKLPRSMKWTCCAVGAIVLGAVTGPVSGQAPAAPLVNAAHLRMQSEDATPTEANRSIPIFGSPDKEGFYVYRSRFGPHQTSRPHSHDKDRWVTVIKGTWYTGEGDVFKPDTMVAIKAGGFMFHPANLHHYDGSMDDNEVIVQLTGYGPMKTTQTEVDAKGNPIGGNPLAQKPPARGRGTTPTGR